MAALPEWYSGSDTSGRVSAGIEAVIERMDAQQADPSDIATLEELREIEREDNWRCFLLGLAGTIHYDIENVAEAETVLRASISGYRVYLPSFDEVLSVYCQSCYTLGVILFDRGELADALPCFMRCVPYMREVYDEVYVGHILTYIAHSLVASGSPELRAVFSEASTFARRGDCESLENLMIAYGATGDLDKATGVFHHLESNCQDYEHFDRVLDYAERNLGESGAVN